TSARLENVEQGAKLLEDAGIEVRITNGRSYKGGIRGNFTYRHEDGQKPAVWIVRSADQPKARAMLREAGLMDSSRNAADSPLAMSFRGTNPDPGRRSSAQLRASRIKLGLLVVIAAIVALAFMNLPSSPPTAPSDTPSGAAPAPIRSTGTRAAVATGAGAGNTPAPDSLAIALLRSELPRRAGAVACIAIDGHDPSPALLAALPPTPGRVLPVSECPAAIAGQPAAQIIAVGKYEANDAGTGTIFLQRRNVGSHAVPQWYNVRRDGEGWRIVQPL
ncbi:MAG: hypothetical protein L0H23_11420, partial [Luteimonas sp.]|nr:hypothetical protein [Luteimonas sp.]